MKKVFGILICLLLLTGCATSHLSNGEESVVTFDEDGISAEELYEKLKEQYGAQIIVDLIDNKLLSDKYENTQEEDDYVNQIFNATKEQYKDDFDAAIESLYQVSSQSAFKDLIRLSYKRNKWIDEYALREVNDTQIDDYYNNVLVGDITASHILITSKATDTMSDEEKKNAEDEALATARSVIDRLNNGESFEDLARELSDDENTKNNGGSLGTFNDRSNYDENFFEEAKNLEVGKYSTTPVKSQYGYHIILKTNQNDKPEKSEVIDSIKSKIAEELQTESGFSTKALLALREENNMKITDSDLEKKYKDFYNLD